MSVFIAVSLIAAVIGAAGLLVRAALWAFPGAADRWADLGGDEKQDRSAW